MTDKERFGGGLSLDSEDSDLYSKTDADSNDMLHIRRVVAGNPNTPGHVLSRLSEDPNPMIRQRIAENPNTPIDVLRKLAGDIHSDVRLAVAENPNASTDILARLAVDADSDVRYGVAESPHMPEQILLLLAQDDNPYVRCRAMKTVRMLSPEVQSRLNMVMQQSFAF